MQGTKRFFAFFLFAHILVSSARAESNSFAARIQNNNALAAALHQSNRAIEKITTYISMEKCAVVVVLGVIAGIASCLIFDQKTRDIASPLLLSPYKPARAWYELFREKSQPIIPPALPLRAKEPLQAPVPALAPETTAEPVVPEAEVAPQAHTLDVEEQVEIGVNNFFN
ncbi:hypothetical protein EBT16_14830 [bacterium]|nr:hypothetical protein [bacterium]